MPAARERSPYCFVLAGGPQKLRGFAPAELADLSRDLVEVEVGPVEVGAAVAVNDDPYSSLSAGPDDGGIRVPAARVDDWADLQDDLVVVSEDRAKIAGCSARDAAKEMIYEAPGHNTPPSFLRFPPMAVSGDLKPHADPDSEAARSLFL
jgi:hypothetical protein